MWLPIEDHPDLYKAFGLTIAWLGAVENQFVHVIKFRCKPCGFCLEAIEGMTFGVMISRASACIDEQILLRLRALNDTRNTLLHGSHAEVSRLASAGTVARTGKFLIRHKGKDLKLNEHFLQETIQECRDIGELLYGLLKSA